MTDLNFSLACKYAARLQSMRKAEAHFYALAHRYACDGDERNMERALLKAEELRRRLYN